MRKKIIIPIISVVLILIVLVVYFTFFMLPKGKIEVSGNPVDNSYNNYINGAKVCRTGNNLYFFYAEDELKNGVIQINSQGSKRIWWLGAFYGLASRVLSDTGIPLVWLREYNGEIWINNGLRYDEKRQCLLEENSILPNEYKTFFRGGPFRETDYGIVYSMQFNDVEQEDCIALYTEGKDKILVSSDDKYYEDYYVSEDSVYYWYYAMETNEKLNLGKYNLATGKDERLFEFPSKDTEIVQLFVSDGKVFVLPRTENESEDTLRKLYQIEKTKDKERKLTLITDDVNLCNTYGNNVYISKGYDGLYVYNVQTKEMNRLSSKCSAQSYIVDDTWVYFTDNNSTLWRVSNDGEKTDKVFG